MAAEKARPGEGGSVPPLIGGATVVAALALGWLLGRRRGSGKASSASRGVAPSPSSGKQPVSPVAGETTGAHLSEAEQFRQLVVQVEGFAIFMLDEAGRNRTWNEGVERLLGYREHEWLGLPADQIFTPEDRAAGVPQRELREAAERGQASDDRWLIRKDGSRFFATGLTTGMRDADGRLIGFSKVFRDRTDERKASEALAESEARLRVALQAARMGIWTIHNATNRLHTDQSMGPLLGLGHDERVESLEQFVQRVHQEDRERVARGFRHSIATGQNMDVEFRVVWPDGTVRWLSDHGQVVRGPSGDPEYLAGAAVDVTERKTADAHLVEAQRMDAVGQLAGGVAHEVNNMMQAVLGYTALLLAGLDRRQTDRPDLLHIQRAAERAATITRQLLAFSRRQVIHPETLDLNQVILEMEPILRRSLGEDREIRFELASSLAGLRADRGSLEQVVLNLALNARDAMPAVGTMILETRQVAHPPETAPSARRLAAGPYVALVVTDTGVGMDEGTRLRAFEPFFTTKPVGQGTGLGLAMVQGIVEQSDGAVRLTSAPGRGTTVEVYFPAVEPASRPAPASTLIHAADGVGTILVVEDEDLVRDFVCRSLQALGYTCWPAATAGEALDLIASQAAPPDVVLTDLVMPGMSGRDLAAQLASSHPATPVLFTSAYSSEEVARRRLVEPGASYLQKPLSIDALAPAVRATIRRPPD
jgi:two-component system cell cycle sensor histidine kinase/response regulator CckA